VALTYGSPTARFYSRYASLRTAPLL